MPKYMCTKEFEIGLDTEEVTLSIKKGSLWEEDEVAGDSDIRLIQVNDEYLYWLELSKETLTEYFKEVKEEN